MKLDNDNITAITGTVIIHIIALILLSLGVLKTYVPLDDGGIPVNFGDYTAVAGIFQPAPSATVAPPQPTQPAPQPRLNQPRQTTTRPAAQPSEETVITQDREETVSVPENSNNTNTAVAEENARREREESERRQREEEQRRQEAIDNLASSAFSADNASENSRGEATSDQSNQGNPYETASSRSNEGAGGFGSFNLSGRTTGSGGLPRPAYTEREEGRIVVNITVDPNGNVILADIGRGTNIDNISMRNSAIDAAKRAKFNRITSTNNQSGTITYNYKFL